MLSALEIYTWNDFVTYLGCVAQVAVVILPIAAILLILIKLFILCIDKAYGYMIKSNHNNNKRKKGK